MVWSPRLGRKSPPLHTAAKSGNVQALEKLLAAASNQHERNLLLESPDHHGKTALLRACKHGHRMVVVALLRAGANLRAIDHLKRNCLHLSVGNGHVDVTLALLRRGAAPLLEQVNALNKRPLDIIPCRNQADIQNLLHQSSTLWSRHRNDTCELNTTVDTNALRSDSEQQHRRASISSHGGWDRSGNGRRMTPAAPARPARSGSGYFIPPQAQPLLPCVPFAMDELENGSSTHSRSSSSRALQSPLSRSNTPGTSVSPVIYATTPNALLSSMPCYLASATAAAQGSSAGESGSETNSDWEPGTCDSRSSVSPIMSRVASTGAFWEVPSKEHSTFTYRTSSMRGTPSSRMSPRVLTTADIYATSREGWAMITTQKYDDMEPCMLVHMAPPASMRSLPSKVEGVSPRQARQSSDDRTLRRAASGTAAGVAGA